jgi:hypothetical protein
MQLASKAHTTENITDVKTTESRRAQYDRRRKEKIGGLTGESKKSRDSNEPNSAGLTSSFADGVKD